MELSATSTGIVAGPIGSIVVWRRLANYGDTLSHSTLLGMALAYIFRINIYFGLVGIGLLLALALTVLGTGQKHANDTMLSIVSHLSLAAGLVLASQFSALNVDILAFLYGDVLAIQLEDLLLIAVLSITILLILKHYWTSIVNYIIHPELAAVEGLAVKSIELGLNLAIAMVFAVAMRLVGALLISALILLPASTARQFTKTPHHMALLASCLGTLAVSFGLLSSLYWDWPSGPAIVLCSGVMFCLSLLKR